MIIFKTSRIVKVLTTLPFLFAVSTACDLQPGIPTTFETVPKSATLLAQGPFTSTNEITGTAQVYNNQGIILLHLEGLSMPTGSIFYLFLENGSPSSPFYMSATKASAGNQNYNTGKRAQGLFSRVVLRINGSTNSEEVATAVLTQIFPAWIGSELNLQF